MALKHLELGDMVALSDAWANAQRSLIEGIPLLAALLPSLDEVGAQVDTVQAREARDLTEQLASISATQGAIDRQHDTLARATSLLLEGSQNVYAHTKPERAATFERARRTIFPEGLSYINETYLNEAGQSKRIQLLLSTETWLRDLLASVPLDDGTTLLSLVEIWTTLGRKLGELDIQKSPLQATLGATKLPSRTDIVQARNKWIGVVNVFLAAMDLVKGHEQALHDLRSPILAVSNNRALGRGASSADSDAYAAEPSPAPLPLAETPMCPSIGEPGGPFSH